MSEIESYVTTDSSGVMRVGGSGVPLDSVLAAFADGSSPESIRSQFPSLALEEVYGAITFCLSHRDEIDAYLKRQGAVWDHWESRSRVFPDPLTERLRSIAKNVQPAS